MNPVATKITMLSIAGAALVSGCKKSGVDKPAEKSLETVSSAAAYISVSTQNTEVSTLNIPFKDKNGVAHKLLLQETDAEQWNVTLSGASDFATNTSQIVKMANVSDYIDALPVKNNALTITPRSKDAAKALGYEKIIITESGKISAEAETDSRVANFVANQEQGRAFVNGLMQQATTKHYVATVQ